MLRFLVCLVLLSVAINCSTLGGISNPKFSGNAVRKPLKDYYVKPSNISLKEEGEYYEEEDPGCCTGDPITFEDGNKFVVTVGVYMDQISSVDITASTYFSTGYLWVKWNSCYTLPDGSPYRPDETVVVENVAQQWATTLSPLQDVVCDTPEPGYSYRDFVFNFNLGMHFSYTRYPIDRQELVMAFEDIVYDDRYVILKADKDSSYSPKVTLPKFEPGDKITRTVDSEQDTTYGLGGRKPTYSRAEIGLVIKRKVSYFIIKILPPIFITLATAVVAFCVDPIHSYERLYIVPGAVLSLVFLQVGFSAETPDGGSMTVTDWVFNWCYFLVLVMLCETGLLALVMSKWEMRVARQVDWEDYEYLKKTVKILQYCRRFCLLIDLVTVIFVALGSTVGTVVVILIARYA